jgi:hypothetical protein
MRINPVLAKWFVMLGLVNVGSHFMFAGEPDVAKETKPPEPRFKISGWLDSGVILAVSSTIARTNQC